MGRPISLTRHRAHQKHTLTMQDRLQDASVTHWGKPIDDALELHLHGASKELTARSWSRWSKKYCLEMLKLVPLVSAAQANELLTAKMATLPVDDRDHGMRPAVVRYALVDVRMHLQQSSGGSESGAGGSEDKTAPGASHGCPGGEDQLGGRTKKTRRRKRAHGKMNK